MRRRHRRGQRGFTLMELLVTLGITVFGLIGILAAHKSLSAGTGATGQAQEAIAVGTQVMESLRNHRPSELPIAVTGGAANPPYDNTTFATILGRNGVSYTAAVDVDEVVGAPALWRFRVAVSWTDDSGLHTLPFELIRTSREAL